MSEIGRREFLGVAIAAAGVTILKPRVVWGSQANSAVRLGLLGCGGRGLSVTGSFLRNTGAVVTAIGDIFPDNLENGKKRLDEISTKLGKPAIDPARMFKGPNAYQQLFASTDVDALYIATPPYFHPMHLEAALASGKHVYLEKPVAVDVPGAKKVMELGDRAKGKVSLAVGFQIRHASPYVELARRIHAGEIGQPVSGQVHYFASAIGRPDWPQATPPERRLRNWVHDKVLSGDIIVEQNVHIIDVTNWMLRNHPVKAVGWGGRAGRTDQGDCWSHFNCVFTYPGDVHVTFASTQFGTASWGVGMQVRRHEGDCRGAVRRAGAHCRRDQVGVPRAREAGGGEPGGRGDGQLPRRARRCGPEQAEGVHRQHHQREPPQRGDHGCGVRARRDPRADGGLHRQRGDLGKDHEVQGEVGPENGLEAVRDPAVETRQGITLPGR